MNYEEFRNGFNFDRYKKKQTRITQYHQSVSEQKQRKKIQFIDLFSVHDDNRTYMRKNIFTYDLT